MNIYERAYSRKDHSWSCRADPGSETETGKVGMQLGMPALVTTGFMKQLRLAVKWEVILFHSFKELFEAWNKLQKSHNYRRRKTTFPRTHNATAAPAMHPLWLLVPAFTQVATAERLTWTEAVPCTSTLQGLLTAGKLSLHCKQRSVCGQSLSCTKKPCHCLTHCSVLGMELVFTCLLLAPLQLPKIRDDKPRGR